jgi:hypothetical protein
MVPPRRERHPGGTIRVSRWCPALTAGAGGQLTVSVKLWVVTPERFVAVSVTW